MVDVPSRVDLGRIVVVRGWVMGSVRESAHDEAAEVDSRISIISERVEMRVTRYQIGLRLHLMSDGKVILGGEQVCCPSSDGMAR